MIESNVLDFFLGRIGVVEAKVAGPLVLGGDAEVQADGLGMADVKVPVRLGRKPRGHTAAVLSCLDVFRHDGPNEIGTRRGFVVRHDSG